MNAQVYIGQTYVAKPDSVSLKPHCPDTKGAAQIWYSRKFAPILTEAQQVVCIQVPIRITEMQKNITLKLYNICRMELDISYGRLNDE